MSDVKFTREVFLKIMEQHARQNITEILTEELLKLLEKKKADFLSLTLGILPAVVKKQLGLPPKATAVKIGKALEPHSGERFRVKYAGGKAYLVSGGSDEELLFRILQKREGKKPFAYNLPFKKDEYADVLSRLSDQGRVRVRFQISSQAITPLLFTVFNTKAPAPETRPNVSEENFKAAWKKLERGKLYVRICELRRYLGWSVPEFDKILTGLRDAGKIQLQGGDIDFYTEDDIRESFVDENGFRRLNIMWRR